MEERNGGHGVRVGKAVLLYRLLVQNPGLLDAIPDDQRPKWLTANILARAIRGSHKIPRGRLQKLRLLHALLDECSGCFAPINEESKKPGNPIRSLRLAIGRYLHEKTKEELPGIKYPDFRHCHGSGKGYGPEPGQR
jgi:hypothetical protein